MASKAILATCISGLILLLLPASAQAQGGATHIITGKVTGVTSQEMKTGHDGAATLYVLEIKVETVSRGRGIKVNQPFSVRFFKPAKVGPGLVDDYVDSDPELLRYQQLVDRLERVIAQIEKVAARPEDVQEYRNELKGYKEKLAQQQKKLRPQVEKQLQAVVEAELPMEGDRVRVHLVRQGDGGYEAAFPGGLEKLVK